MLSAVLESIDSPLSIIEVELTELRFGQVLTRNLVSGLCGSQLLEIRGHKGNANFIPHLLGHEGCGIVESVGPGVTKLKPGDKVVLHWRTGKGIESDFPKYKIGNNFQSSGKITTLSQYSIVSENRLTIIPQETSPDFAALLGCSLTTAFGIIENDSELKYGESVAIIGLGGVGLNLIQASRLKGAGEITCVDKNNEKNSIAMNLNANYFYPNLDELKTYDVVIDTTGNPAVINRLLNNLNDSGRLILCGQGNPSDKLLISNYHQLFKSNGSKIKTSQGGNTNPDLDIPRYLKLFDLGLIDISKIVTHRYRLSEINTAINVLKSGIAGRIMIDLR